MGMVYPRLPLAVASGLTGHLRVVHEGGGVEALTREVHFSHPNASPVATGGRVATVEDIKHLRDAVIDAMQPWMTGGAQKALNIARFDVALGHGLHDALDIIPADAAHDETWSFLTLVVFPDLAALRFPDMHDSRMLGKPRNVLRRVWLRASILGDVLYDHPRPLGEDEAVGLFERTSLARNHRLVRIAAMAVMEKQGATNRSEWARHLYKLIRYATGPAMLDVLTEEELGELVADAAARTDAAFACV